MSGVVKAVKGVIGGLTGRDAAKASEKAADTSAQAQREALEYLKETEELPQQFRQGALSQLGGLYGLEGGDAMATRNLERSPLFRATLGDIGQQEEAILRNQSATGALRSSGTEQMLAENQRQRQLAAYQNALQPLQGLAGLQSMAPQIAQGMAGIGDTLAQGQVAAAQARQQGIGNMAKLGMNAAMAFSDARLKDNVQPMGERYGHAWYTWTWNEEAEKLGLSGDDEGVMAHEVAKTNPELVNTRDGYLVVNYAGMGEH